MPHLNQAVQISSVQYTLEWLFLSLLPRVVDGTNQTIVCNLFCHHPFVYVHSYNTKTVLKKIPDG